MSVRGVESTKGSKDIICHTLFNTYSDLSHACHTLFQNESILDL